MSHPERRETPMKYALNLSSATQLGTSMAAQGWTKAQVSEWCTKGGYSATGMSFQRIVRAFNAQVARG